MDTPQQMLFFDGTCGLCQYSVQALLRHDRRKTMCFAPLQGETAKRVLAELEKSQLLEVDSVIWVDGGKAYVYSGAGIRAVAACGGVWSLFKVLLVVPPVIRNVLYRAIAKRRKGFFKNVSCKIPTPEESQRILP